MIGKTNAELVLCFLTVNCMNSATVTATNGNLSITRTGATTEFKLPRTGTWTITATFNGITQVRSVTLAGGQSATVTFPSDIYLYNRGAYAEGFAGGWTDGAESNQVHLQVPANGTRIARTYGSIDLTGISTVKIEYAYNIGSEPGTGYDAWFELYIANDGGGSILTLVSQHAGAWEIRGSGTAVANVSGINQVARFAMNLGGRGSPGSVGGHSYLYSVEVIK